MVDIVVLVHAIERQFHGSCCRATDMWTQDVVQPAAVSDATRLCVLGHPSFFFPGCNLGKACYIVAIYVTQKLVKHALQLLDRS